MLDAARPQPGPRTPLPSWSQLWTLVPRGRACVRSCVRACDCLCNVEQKGGGGELDTQVHDKSIRPRDRKQAEPLLPFPTTPPPSTPPESRRNTPHTHLSAPPRAAFQRTEGRRGRAPRPPQCRQRRRRPSPRRRRPSTRTIAAPWLPTIAGVTF